MKRRLAITRILLAAVVLGMVGLSSLGYLMQRSDLRTLQQLSKENLTWSAAQIEIELQRFMGSVSALALGDSAVTADDVIDRFDILWSRVAIFENGDVAARYAHYDEDRATITALFDTMKAREEVVLSLTSDDQDVARGLIGDFAKHAGPLRSISVRIVSGEEAFEAEARDGLRAGQAMAATLSGGAVIMAGLLMAVAFFEARKYRRLADHNAHLASEAEAANQAKSRFLTMMSHELRTPMNGVLGQLALAKLPGLPAPQLRLVEQAERSGRQMIGMLTDILDFSALQENR
ncbi:MAG: histidine kinase dimerization/phospho-acceptor domain-containing protein, partial [Pseudomonadota bacterium]